MGTAETVLNWATVVAQLIPLGIATEAQIAAVIALLLKAEHKSDVDYAPEDATLSAETHSILQGIIAKAQA